jgi:ketosteroid isomerase-like protein
MRRLLMCAGVAALLLVHPAIPVRAGQGEEVLSLYRAFAAAQNRRDTAAVRKMLWESPDFLWISDGRPYWGRETMLLRMAQFQKADVWRVEPDYASARVVRIGDDAAYVHIPLILVIGAKDDPARLRWLVEVVCRRTPDGWRIAGLFTAPDKRL